jgi:type III secretion protein L
MMIWLRNPQAEGSQAGYGVGVDGDVLRGEHFSTLVDIDMGYDAMRKQCDGALDAARAEARSIMDDARSRADELLARAQEDYERAERRGYDDGVKQGLTDWHERALSTQADAQTLASRQRDRLAELVALAVEQIVASEDRRALFRRAAAAIEQIVADGSPVHVRVHPSDLLAATTAFEEVARDWRDAARAVRLQVHPDAALAQGACVCETDLGAVDASLSLQLEAMRAALARAVRSVSHESGSSS